MSDRPSPLLQLTLLRARMFLREPSALFWTYGFPLLLALALGIAFRQRGPEPVDVAVQEGPGAMALVGRLAALPDGRVRVLPEREATRALRAGKVAVVVVPLAPGDGDAPPAYRFDPARPEGRLARALVDDALEGAAGRRAPSAAHDRPVTEPGGRYIDFLLPGLLGFNLMSSGLWGVGFVLVEMRTRKLLKRLVATPMRRGQFLLSFVLTRALFLLLELPVLVGFGSVVFDVPVRGSLALLVGLATLGSLTFAGLGLLVASRAENTQTVAGLVNLVTMPMAVGSGVFFSSTRFPEAVQPVLQALPLTALNDALREVMLDGAGLAQIGARVLTLLAWGAASFALALRLFRWR